MNKRKLLFVITQFYKGGAEVALQNLFHALDKEKYEVDFLIFDQMILNNATSLIPQIPDWVTVCNAAEREGQFAVVLKILFKVYRRLTKHQLYRPLAYRFVKGKKYDAAFSYGEWLSPEFVAKKVDAKKKLIWIHTDIDKAAYVDEKILLGYDSFYDKYIFVSEKSKRAAEKKYGMLRGKSEIIHNLCDEGEIRKKACQVPEDLKRILADKNQSNCKLIVSVGNLREEKNYPRHIEVLRCLIKLKINCCWLCIGSDANTFLLRQVQEMLRKYGLQQEFHFIGVRENPYPYMKHADLIALLSDFESWSMVITEAKLLGTPIAATRTSGAAEQIEDGKTGLLTSFEPEEIAKRLKEYFESPEVEKRIRNNLGGFTMKQNVMAEFEKCIGKM